MKVKRFFAAEMRQALREVREVFGPDAVILANREVDGGVELIAAIDYDAEALSRSVKPSQASEKVTSLDKQEGRQPRAAANKASVDKPAVSSPKFDANVVWMQDAALENMRAEMSSLRSIVEHQLSGLAWADFERRHPSHSQLLKRLMGLGLNASICHRIADTIAESNDIEHSWRQALARLAAEITIADDDILNNGGTIALVGPTGVGKTTTIAKLAARYVLRHGPHKVALVTTDNYRVGAYEQLRVFSRILDVPLHCLGRDEKLDQVLESLLDKHLVLIDTAGVGPRDKELAQRLQPLIDHRELFDTWLVLSANSQLSSMEKCFAAFAAVKPSACVLTKVDEAESLGAALGVLIHTGTPLTYVCDGQRVPEDLHMARAHSLVSEAVSLSQNNYQNFDWEVLALVLGERAANAYN